MQQLPPPSGNLGRGVEGYTIDNLPPNTMASPATGSYDSAKDVTLSCSDLGGGGCDGTLYCFGTSCVPDTQYLAPIHIASSQVLRFNSKDKANNVETVKEEAYSIAMGVSATPQTISTGYQGSVAIGISNIAAVGSTVLVDQLVDVDENGLANAGDYVVRSFSLTDGVTSGNPNVQGDEDGAANSSITSNLNYYLLNDLYHAPGHYVFRVTNGDKIATVPFVVTAEGAAQSISGTVTATVGANTAPVPGAIVQVTDKWQRSISFAIADGSGQYTLAVKNPGDYLVKPSAYGYATSAASITPVTLAEGQSVVNNNLTLAAGAFHVTGQLKDDTSGAGIASVCVEASGSDYREVAMTDANGNYDLLLPAGNYTIAASIDSNGPTPFAKGYAVYTKQPVSVNLSADVSGQDIVLSKGRVLVTGRVADQSGQALPGMPVQGAIRGTSDPREPVALGVTDGNGNYTLSLINADHWNISLVDAAAQAKGYLGSVISDFSIASPLTGNDLTAYPVTAWVLGTVKDANGIVLSGVPVQIRNANSSQLATANTAADGSYHLGAYAADWLVNAMTAEKGLYPVRERSVSLADGQNLSVDFTADVTLPTLTPTALANGTYNVPYSQTVTAIGSVAPYSYSVTGTLPDGLALDPVSGAIGGIPTASDVTSSFTVRATDANDLTVDQVYSLTIYGYPIAHIISPVPGFTNNNKPWLQYLASGGTVVVKVDGQVVDKVSGQALDQLSDGNHFVDLYVTNPVGVIAQDRVLFTVDTVPPSVVIASPAAATTNVKAPVLFYMVSDGSVVVKVDGAVVNKISGQALDSLPDGPHTVLVLATDDAGNPASASVTFTVDTVPPSVTVNAVSTPTRASSQTLSGTVEAGAMVTVAANTGALVGTVTYPAPGSWSCQVSGLAPGNNTFAVTATDVATNSSTVSVTISYRPPMAATLSPITIGNDFKGTVTLAISDLATSGSDVVVEQFVDANRNGVIDAGDYVIRSFKVTDGTVSSNSNVQGDEDGAANTSVATTLNYYLLNDLYHAPGQYLFRVTSGADTALAPFAINAVTQPQSISGTVSVNSAPQPGALVQLTDKWQRPVAFTLADQNGRYALYAKDAGSYLVTPVSYGFATNVALTPVAVAAGQGIEGHDLGLLTGLFHAAGRVKDDATGAGIGGIWVKASGANVNATTITGADGSYSLSLPAGQYSISAATDPTVPNPSHKGYLAYNKQAVAANVSADVNLADINLPQATILVSGKALNGQGTAVPGMPVQGKTPGTVDVREPVAWGVTKADGGYTLAVTAGNDWNISLPGTSAEGVGYIGNVIGNFSTSNGTLAGNDLTVYPITAWVQGMVTDSNNNAVAGGDVRLRNADSSIVSTITSVADGTYRIGTFAGNWRVDDVTHNIVNQTLEQAVTLVDGQTATVDFVVDVTPPTLGINPVVTPTTSSFQTITGTVEAGSTIMVAVDTTVTVGAVSYPTASSWSCILTGLIAGDNGNNITVTATDPAGNATVATTRVLFVDTYDITAIAGSNGSISPSGTTAVPSGGSQAYTITPNEGYHILSVKVDNGPDISVTSYPFSNVLAPHTIAATFAANTYIITAKAENGGAVTPVSATVNYGGSQNFTITPSAGYKVASVMVDGVPVEVATSYSFTGVTAAHTISVTFQANSISFDGVIEYRSNSKYFYTSNGGIEFDDYNGNGTWIASNGVDLSSGGYIDGGGCDFQFAVVSNSAFTITCGSTITVSVGGATIVSNGLTALKMSGTLRGEGNRLVFYDQNSVLLGDIVFTAVPAVNISASTTGLGYIDTGGVSLINVGDSRTFTMVPDAGYHVADVVVDGRSVGAVMSYTFNAVSVSHSISVTFVVNPAVTITASAGLNGTMSPSGSVPVTIGLSQKFSFYPAAGYRVGYVLVDNVSVGAPTSYTFSNVTANHTISVTFYPTITATTGANGSISPSGVTAVSNGANKTFTITPAASWVVAKVEVDGTSVGAVNTYTFSNVTVPHTIYATFLAPLSITASAGTGGAISSSGTVAITTGASKTYTMTASAGYVIAGVAVDGISVGAVSSYTFTNITVSHTISVTFNPTITATSGANGGISPGARTTVTAGGSQSYTITPNAGYQVAGVLIDGISLGTLTTYTFQSVTVPHTISATFALKNPDLVITAISAPSGIPAGWQQQLTIPVTVKNQGTLDAGGFYLDLRLSTDSTITATDTMMGRIYVTGLAAGARLTENFTVTLPAVSAGTYYVGAIADPTSAVQEADETNNTSASAMSVTSGTINFDGGLLYQEYFNVGQFYLEFTDLWNDNDYFIVASGVGLSGGNLDCLGEALQFSATGSSLLTVGCGLGKQTAISISGATIVKTGDTTLRVNGTLQGEGNRLVFYDQSNIRIGDIEFTPGVTWQ